MKKKGLIISTIVMVVVLIASLTTATYAWFNASAAAEVAAVQVSVASTSNISIGVAKNVRTGGTGDVGGARNTATSYVNGTIRYTETSTAADQSKGLGDFTSTDSKAGLGLNIAWDNWALSTKGGVSSSANSTAFDVGADNATAYVPANALYNGSMNSGTLAVTEKARYNNAYTTGTNTEPTTVIFAPIGLRVEKEEKDYLYCDITITPDDPTFWGIVTALKVEINTGTNTYYYRPFDLYDSSADATANNKGVGLTSTAALTYQDPAPNALVFRFVIAHATSGHLLYNGQTGAQIYQFDLRMFIDGADDNCIADATQYGATIGLKFDAVSTEDFNNLTPAAAQVVTLG